MDITGPFLDRTKKRRDAPLCWYFRYAPPKLNPDGTAVLDAHRTLSELVRVVS